MPPKVRITKEDITRASLELVRSIGPEGLNARKLATFLDCSTQPIFSNFSTMEELQKATISEAYNLYLSFIKREVNEGNYPTYKAYGMAYIRFAMEEKQLFKLLFMRDRSAEDISPSPDFKESVQIISKTTGLSYKRAELLHLETWTCAHGIGVMLATSFLPLEWELASNMLSDVYQGILSKHLSEDGIK